MCLNYFLVVLFVTPAVQKIGMAPTAGLFVMEAPPLLGSSTSNFSAHTPIFFPWCRLPASFFLQNLDWCKKVTRGPVHFFLCVYMHMYTRYFYMHMILKHLLLYILLCLNTLQAQFFPLSECNTGNYVCSSDYVMSFI